MDDTRYGGAEKQIISLINGLDSDRYRVSLGCLNNRDDLSSQIDDNKVQRIIRFNRRRRFDISVLCSLKEILKADKYDIVFCITQHPMLYAYLVKAIWRVRFRLVTAVHLTIPKRGIWVKFKNYLYQKILNRCDTILFVCQKQMDYWINTFHVKPEIADFIYNGVDTAILKSDISQAERKKIQKTYRLERGDIVLGNVAVLRPEKQHKYIVKAAKSLREDGYPVKVLIVGDGPCRGDILSYARSHGMQDHVSITGFQEDVRPYLSLFDCKIISSDAVETFSIAGLEAMAMAKPLILTDIGGASEMVEEGVNGFLYPAGDTDLLVEKLKYAIDNDLFKKMGKKGRQTVEEKFTLDRMIAGYEKCFNS